MHKYGRKYKFYKNIDPVRFFFKYLYRLNIERTWTFFEFKFFNFIFMNNFEIVYKFTMFAMSILLKVLVISMLLDLRNFLGTF